MKAFTLASAILLVAGLGVSSVNAEAWREGERDHAPLAFIAEQLALTDAQKAQIEAIWKAERVAIGGLMREFNLESEEMNAVSAQATFDPAKVQAIADRQGATLSRLLVEEETLKSRVYTTVLTPQQRAMASRLEKRSHARLGWLD